MARLAPRDPLTVGDVQVDGSGANRMILRFKTQDGTPRSGRAEKESGAALVRLKHDPAIWYGLRRRGPEGAGNQPGAIVEFESRVGGIRAGGIDLKMNAV